MATALNPESYKRDNQTVMLGDAVTGWRSSLGLDGVTLPPAPPFDHEADTRQRVHAARRERWEKSCPVIYRQSDWSHPGLIKNRAQIERVLKWSCAEPKGLLLSGATGLGKTRALWALADKLTNDGVDVRVFPSAEFFRRAQEFVNYGRDESAAWIQAIIEIPVLALDDLGQEGLVQSKENWAQSIFLQILDGRLCAAKPTLISTNLTASDLAGGQANSVRANPMIRRLLDLCEVIKFEA